MTWSLCFPPDECIRAFSGEKVRRQALALERIDSAAGGVDRYNLSLSGDPFSGLEENDHPLEISGTAVFAFLCERVDGRRVRMVLLPEQSQTTAKCDFLDALFDLRLPSTLLVCRLRGPLLSPRSVVSLAS